MNTEDGHEPKTESPSSPPDVKAEEDQSNVLTILLYTWGSILFSRGWERHIRHERLEDEDLLLLPRNEDIDKAHRTFEVLWTAELKAAADEGREPSLARVLVKANRKYLIVGAIFRAIADAASVANPFILQGAIGYLSLFPNAYAGYLWAIGLASVQLVSSICNNASMFYTQKAFSNMRIALVLSLFDKVLRLDATHGLTGNVMQLHTTDTYKFIETAIFVQQLWSAPLIIIAALVSMYFFIGFAGLLSIAVLLLTLPINALIMFRNVAARNDVSRAADRRINLVGEILQGIRIVKFMSWEEPMKDRVQSIRDEELGALARIFTIRSFMMLIVSSLPMVVSFVVFASAFGFGNPILARDVFPTVAMLGVLRLPTFFLPLGLSRAVDLKVSLERIRAVLTREDRHSYVVRCALDKDAIEMKNVTVLYPLSAEPAAAPAADTTDGTKAQVDDASPIGDRVLMSNINLSIPKGKLTVIVGPTGCGKTTLINAMLGEQRVTADSSVRIDGSLALVAQEAWIMNATVRDNILMGLPYDHARYVRVINDCQLMADLRQLRASDMTEIGERGINLSGGQKQRVSIARAMYSGAETVLMDDPLSAVDAHVCSKLFSICIQRAMRGRTRVLVTHYRHLMEHADHVIVMKDRSIVFAGTYAQFQRAHVDVDDLEDQEEDKAALQADDDAPDNERPSMPMSFAVDETEIPVAEQDGELIAKEGREQGEVRLATVLWYFGMLGYGWTLLVLVLFAAWRVATILNELMLSYWSTRALVFDRYFLTPGGYLFWYGMLVIISIGMVMVRQVPFAYSALRSCRQSHTKMLQMVLHAPMWFFDTTPMGRITVRFSKDLEGIDLNIPDALNFFYQLLMVVLGAIGLIASAAPYILIVVAVLIITFVLVFRYYAATNRQQKRLESVNRSPMSNIMNETLGGLITLRAFNMESNVARRHHAAVALSATSVYSWRFSQRWISTRVDAISAALILATMMIVTGVLHSMSLVDRLNTLPTALLAVTYSLAITGAIGFMTTQIAELESSMNSVERVKEYTDSLPQEREVEYGSGEGQVPDPGPEWPSAGDVRFDNVSLRYQDGLPLVLKDVTFHVEPRMKVGVVGRTGSGKSTLMLALFRLIELAEGVITIDGVSIANLTTKDVRRGITIIPQDPLLFAGTVRSNLDPFSFATDEEVVSILRRVGLWERVETDGGLQAPVSERGGNFSVGQRQLLCLARALLKKCRVLLLDEATASVDFESDAMIQRTIRSEFSDCTVITIAHRLATIIDSDRVLVMADGRVNAYATPHELLQEDTLFHSMVKQLGEEQYRELCAAAAAKYKSTA